ncbi:MAG: nucleotidyl transferase AbiEii/AbiGii toxin family protein [Thermoanaerobaculia bacterium]
MNEVREYATPLAFKQALEARLRASSATGVDLASRRQLLVFDRFLVRLSQVVRKLHALTMPRPRPNSRVRDLPDLALLAMTGPIDGKLLRQAIERTFTFRDTHAVPASVPRPPDFWDAQYATLAVTSDLPWPTLEHAMKAVSVFINPVLRSKTADATWKPEEWEWR